MMPFDGTELPPLAKQLIAARDYMKEHGWCQERSEDVYGRVCMMGALEKIGNGFIAPSAVLMSVLTGPNRKTVVKWNDTRSRTYEQVMAAWDRAIAKAIADGGK